MMKWALDTNAVISLVSGRSAALALQVQAQKVGDIAVSAIVAHELYFGAYKSQRVEYNLETLRLLLRDFCLLELDQNDARIAGEIRAELARAGTPIGPYDVLIAGQAKARGLTLVTNNVGEFKRVAGLQIADWTTE
ncbi:type II toxin-antitoxin system VapC family toxin [Devosia rhizoryzae]|uniref:Ribonuclease VapC n=1 Tax=Devosia rhizoryzae TaxID=2774137 RepID=A0ABX7CEV9_9HYPH|nr:type II toxin-antitoxin system VapC family toxin [Devosia rhizoryzae]QQR41155.1 type II toxin-antitoxin system VapC family toxin [Devosia rhizoryzae]